MKIIPRIPAVAKTYGRAFVAVVLFAFIADGADVFAVSVTDLKTWLAAGLAASGAVALKALDSSEPDFGRFDEAKLEGDE
jgi:hypothetical protein